jgi:Xaa-Pro aminopeptidase
VPFPKIEATFNFPYKTFKKSKTMFAKEVYWQRRKMLRALVGDGLILIAGNEESSMNYSANTYHFRQDSSFLYFFGIDKPGFYGICDVDNDRDTLYGDDFTIDDIIWMGEQPSVKELAGSVGVETTGSASELSSVLKQALQSGRKVHLLPPYRGDHTIKLAQMLDLAHKEISKLVSQELIDAVVKLRAVKDQYEINEIEKAVDVARIMHTTAMKMAYPGNFERELAGAIEGIALSHGGPVSFPVILSMDGQTLHNHYHGNELTEGRMVVCDAGAETALCYASDITRTFPVGGKFSSQQKDIYNIVLKANLETIKASVPGKTYREVHLMAARIIAGGLKELGIMKGDLDEAVEAGAHALFFPHGLGHMLGLDVHDMEGLGENHVGYSRSLRRSDQFGLAYLRLGRELEPGFVITNEPGCYFIPALIDQWKGEKKHAQFINYEQVEKYRGRCTHH